MQHQECFRSQTPAGFFQPTAVLRLIKSPSTAEKKQPDDLMKNNDIFLREMSECDQSLSPVIN